MPDPPLTEYRRKRRFSETPEPGGAAPHAGDDSRFVVHEHHARRIHWDLRLEHDGTLASWAVPNGIPLDPRHNRKAVHVEDHPLEYLQFEGTIPTGSYGAGEISVWDRGTYTREKWRSREVIVVFHGERLNGRYALFQAGADERDWMIHRMDPPVDPTAQELPQALKPMLAKRGALPSDQPAWAFEVGWDGERALARSQPGRFQLLDARGVEITATFPELRPLNRALGSREALLDGEVVALDGDGRPDRDALRARLALEGETAVRRAAEGAPVTYVAFDLLWLDGHSLLDLPYARRRERLRELGLNGPRWRTPEHFAGEGDALLAAAAHQGLRHIVAKRLDSAYAPGRRNGDWLAIDVPAAARGRRARSQISSD